MSRIQLLAEDVASQVAAGEVIERPASVVKELVENSLDAESTRIEIMTRRGGRSLIRVADDGVGMDRDDALLCLERHATSKIRSGRDLASISTLGFRGEALPSIASVSRFRLTTREREAVAGTEIVVAGGRIDSVHDAGEAPGTQIEVRSLFYNLPARRKFLRTEKTESSHIEQQMHLQAIGHPDVAFTLVADERVVMRLPSADSLLQRIRDISGGDFAAQLIEVPETLRDGIRLRGYIGRPGVSRSSRAQQIVFLNGRAIENPTLSVALREGYHTALMKGQYPITYLMIDMDPAAVDVNVHPAKREVRFRDPSGVKEAVVRAVRDAIESGRATWERSFQRSPDPFPGRPAAAPIVPTAPEPSLLPPKEQHALRTDWWQAPSPSSHAPPVETRLPPPGSAPPAPAAPPSSDFRVLGILGRLYVLMENASGLVLVDQHAAHERILFEELRNRMEAQGVPSQRLLMPLTIQVTPRDSDWLARNLPTLQKMGLGIEPFGTDTFKIDALPQFLKTGDPQQFLRDIIEELGETSTQSSKLRLGEDVIATTVCRHAVKANDVLREPEVVRMIQDLLACELPYCCPHGRPTMIQISYDELERKFGRRAP